MKKQISTLGVLIVTINFLLLQPASSQTQDVYSIQLAAMKFAVGESAFSTLNGVKTFHCNDGLIRYVYGEFNNYEQAKQELNSMKKLFTGAFVINFNEFSDKYLVAGQKAQSSYSTPTSVRSTSTQQGASPPSTIYTDYDNISYSSQTTSNEQELYTIQLSALKYPAYLTDFSPIRDVKEFYPPDGIYRYCTGTFSTKEEAERHLQVIKGQGYPNAYITKMNKYIPYELK